MFRFPADEFSGGDNRTTLKVGISMKVSKEMKVVAGVNEVFLKHRPLQGGNCFDGSGFAT